MEDPVNTAEFWEACYETEMDNWDIGGPTPTFERLSKDLPKGKICVIGCGRGYDTVTFAKAGFEVTAVDFARSAVLATRENARKAEVDISVETNPYQLRNLVNSEMILLLNFVSKHL